MHKIIKKDNYVKQVKVEVKLKIKIILINLKKKKKKEDLILNYGHCGPERLII